MTSRVGSSELELEQLTRAWLEGDGAALAQVQPGGGGRSVTDGARTVGVWCEVYCDFDEEQAYLLSLSDEQGTQLVAVYWRPMSDGDLTVERLPASASTWLSQAVWFAAWADRTNLRRALGDE